MQKNRHWRHITETTNVEAPSGGVMGIKNQKDPAAMLVDAGGSSAISVVGRVVVGFGCDKKGSA